MQHVSDLHPKFALRHTMCGSMADIQSAMAETCPSLADCTLMCVDGYARRADDCYVCQCVQPEFGQYRQLVAALVHVGIYDFYKQFQMVKIRTY